MERFTYLLGGQILFHKVQVKKIQVLIFKGNRLCYFYQWFPEEKEQAWPALLFSCGGKEWGKKDSLPYGGSLVTFIPCQRSGISFPLLSLESFSFGTHCKSSVKFFAIFPISLWFPQSSIHCLHAHQENSQLFSLLACAKNVCGLLRTVVLYINKEQLKIVRSWSLTWSILYLRAYL